MRQSLVELLKLASTDYDWVMKPRGPKEVQGGLPVASETQPAKGGLDLGGYTPPDLNVPKNMMTKKLNKNALGSYVSSFSPDIEQPEESEDVLKKRTRYMNIAKRAQQGGVNG